MAQHEQIQNLLERGDALALQGQFQQAIEIWTQISDTKYQDKVQERVMQVSDLITEEAQIALEESKLHKALDLIQIPLMYSDNEFLLQVNQDIASDIERRIEQIEQIRQEAQKHMANRQFRQAAETIDRALDLCVDDENIMKEKEEYLSVQKSVEEDEHEYMELLTRIRELEKLENYEDALHALKLIRAKLPIWNCLVQNPAPEIERMTNLLISQNYSKKAKTILLKIINYLEKNDLKKANDLMQDAVFSYTLIPSVQKHYDSIKLLIEQKQRKQKIFWICIGIFSGLGLLFLLAWILSF
jgi:tetratricopeptide (TPR) repeat protein